MATTASCLQVAGAVVVPGNDVVNIGCLGLAAGEAELAYPTVPFEDGCSDTDPVTRQPLLAVAGLPCHVTPIGREWTGVSTPDQKEDTWVVSSDGIRMEPVWGTGSLEKGLPPR